MLEDPSKRFEAGSSCQLRLANWVKVGARVRVRVKVKVRVGWQLRLVGQGAAAPSEDDVRASCEEGPARCAALAHASSSRLVVIGLLVSLACAIWVRVQVRVRVRARMTVGV